MSKQILNTTDLSSYLIECTLATIGEMAGKKSRSKSEYTRQINIAQKGIDTWRGLKIPVSECLPEHPRTKKILETGISVAEWAKTFEV
jgi:hypothetical protein